MSEQEVDVAPPVGPTADEIAGEVLKQQQAVAPEVKMTDEELKEYLQVFEPDEVFAEAFRTVLMDEEATGADRVKAFQPLIKGIVNQSVRGAELLMEEKLATVNEKFGTAAAYAQQAQANAMWDDFSGKYPVLKEHKELVDMVSTNLLTAGYKPTSKGELYDKVATGAAGMIQKFDQNFKLDDKKQQQLEMPEMVASGGSPQGGPGALQTSQEGSVESIWD